MELIVDIVDGVLGVYPKDWVKSNSFSIKSYTKIVARVVEEKAAIVDTQT